MGNDQILDRLNSIDRKLDKVNGAVAANTLWIAGQRPVCEDHAEDLHSVTARVSEHQSYIDRNKGTRFGMGEVARTIFMFVTLGVAVFAIVFE